MTWDEIEAFLLGAVIGVLFTYACLPMVSEGAEFKPLQLSEVSLNYKHFTKDGRDPLFVLSPPKEELNLKVNFTVLKYLFMNNRVHAMTDESQYHIVGWNYVLGLHISSYLDVQCEHFSRHLLDSVYPYQRFPVENSVGFTLFMYRNPAASKTILP